MPRKAPTEVIEHRITLGDYERKELKEALDVRDRQVMIENAIKGSGAVLAVSGLVGSTYLMYIALKGIYGFVDDVTGPLSEIIFGKATYPTKDPPPANPDAGVNRDPDTGERINPVHNVPIMGGLVGAGIQIGEAIPVGSFLANLFD